MKLRAQLISVGIVLVALALVHSGRRSVIDPILATPNSPVASSEGTPAGLRESRRAPTPQVRATPANWHERLLGDGSDPNVSRAAIDRWISAGHTNAEELLGVRQAGGGKDYLRLALTNFPLDPRVLLAASVLDESPEATRYRLDRLKEVAPDNALADYLSARDHFKNGRADQAIVDLQAATGKAHFQDYMIDSIQNAEDLYLAAGKSAAEAKALAVTGALLPHLAEFKNLAQDMAELQKQYIAAGDTRSAEQLARMGYQMGYQLTAGGGSGTVLGQLYGAAIERIVLSPLDPTRSYDFLSGTVAENLTEVAARREAVKEDSQFLGEWMRRATDAEIVSYFDRWKLYGENNAIQWLRQRAGSAPGR